MNDWRVLSHYDRSHLREVFMPVGGIGTGFFTLSGRGQLTDWQLMSRPNRGWHPKYAHLLLRTKVAGAEDDTVTLRVLEDQLHDGLANDFGVAQTLAGIPRMTAQRFEATYPFGRVFLADDDLPVDVAIEAFNPLIPGDTDASSLPLGLLSVTLENKTDSTVEASLSLLLSNFIGSDGIKNDLTDNLTEVADAAGWHGFQMSKQRAERNAQNGTLAVLCDAPDVRVACRWPFRGRAWGGEALGIIDSLLEEGFIANVTETDSEPKATDVWDSSLSALTRLDPREIATVRLLITWHFPYRNLQDEGWETGIGGAAGSQADPIAENYYTLSFANALAVAENVLPRLPDLRGRTIAFLDSVLDRDAPDIMKEAALFNLTPLRTHTTFRLADGLFAGYEGCGGTTGCCHGSCTHVWNYEEAVLSLFPDLHRSMLDSHLNLGVTAQGAQRFRLTLPVLNNPQIWKTAAADGQMGMIVRAYQQFLADRQTDGEAWLRQRYPTLKKLLAFAWEPNGWDADKDGVMEGAQHNTYDVEFFGPNPQCTVWYLAALAAMEKMAAIVGDSAFATECGALRKRGKAWVDEYLYNGSYYVQIVVPMSREAAPFTAMGNEQFSDNPRFQIGNGCLIDQLVGQVKANRAGLGDLLDSEHLQTASKAIFTNNFRRDFHNHYNNMRTYATGDEQGTLICSYPEGDRPAVPFPYWAECMTGFEYALAVLLLDYGYREEATAVVKAIRHRHNGANRNPFNEPECGSYYARAMAAWALLDAWDNAVVSPL